MGRIKSTMIKKAAKQLLVGENRFNEDFHHNTKILVEGMPSKPIRNKIAGYITRLVRMEKAKKMAPKTVEQTTAE
jgi:small subunit ribosomal protein S17e